MTHQAPDPQAPHILVVDDEADLAHYLALRLRHSGYNAKSCDCGKNALIELERQPYRFIVSDWTMPQMSGMDLIDKAHEKYPKIKAILLTGHEEMEDEDFHDHGVVTVLIKPYDFSNLLKIIEDSLKP